MDRSTIEAMRPMAPVSSQGGEFPPSPGLGDPAELRRALYAAAEKVDFLDPARELFTVIFERFGTRRGVTPEGARLLAQLLRETGPGLCKREPALYAYVPSLLALAEALAEGREPEVTGWEQTVWSWLKRI
jgi:hypothetical protein